MKHTKAHTSDIKKSSSDLSSKARIVAPLFFILLSISAFNPIAAQCAMCRASLESAGDQQLAEGINNGIIFLMAIPYILVAVLGYFIVRMLRKNKTQKPS